MTQRLHIQLDPDAILHAFVELDAFRFSPPLDLKSFLRLADACDVPADRDLLERLEESGLFRPLFHARFPISSVEIEGEKGTEIHEEYVWPDFRYHNLSGWLGRGHLVPSTHETFIPWIEFRGAHGRDRAQPYYSPFQLYTLDYRMRTLTLAENAVWLAGAAPGDASAWFASRQEWATSVLDSATRVENPRFDAVVVCQAIAPRYFFQTQTDGRNIATSDPASPNKPSWDDYCHKWDPQRVLGLLGLRAEEIREYQEMVSAAATFRDPLADWYDLVSLVALERKKRLKGSALLAQTLYSMEHMLRLFYGDLTGKELKPPGGHRTYRLPGGTSEVHEVGDVRYLRYVANRYHVNPQPYLVLFVEGLGESEAFPRLAQRVFGVSFEDCGIEIRSLGGVQGFEGTTAQRYGTLERVIEELHDRQTLTFVVLDNEGRSRRSLLEVREALATKPSRYRPDRTITRREFIQIWRRSFEVDNFVSEEIARALTTVAEARYVFSSLEVEEALTMVARGNPLERLYEAKLGYGLPKVKLALTLCDLIPLDEPCERRPLLLILREVMHLAMLNHQPTLAMAERRNQVSGYLGHPMTGPDTVEERFKLLRQLQEPDEFGESEAIDGVRGLEKEPAGG